MNMFVLAAALMLMMLIMIYLYGLFKNGSFGKIAFAGGGGWRPAIAILKDKLFMALTADEQKTMDDLKAENAKVTKELEDAKKLIPKAPELPGIPPKVKTPNEKTLEEQARENAIEREKIEKAQKVIEDAVKFDYDIKNKITENLSIVGEEVKTILDLAAGRDYKDSVEKANELRSSILNSFFAKQEHIDALVTDAFKEKASNFLKLTQIKKNELSGQYWELFDLAVENIKAQNKQAELQKKSEGKQTSESVSKHNDKFFSARSQYIPEK